jgi:hypothetical protein
METHSRTHKMKLLRENQPRISRAFLPPQSIAQRARIGSLVRCPALQRLREWLRALGASLPTLPNCAALCENWTSNRKADAALAC